MQHAGLSVVQQKVAAGCCQLHAPVASKQHVSCIAREQDGMGSNKTQLGSKHAKAANRHGRQRACAASPTWPPLQSTRFARPVKAQDLGLMPVPSSQPYCCSLSSLALRLALCKMRCTAALLLYSCLLLLLLLL